MRSFAVAATIVASASVAVADGASATVKNNCDFPIYLWNVVDYTTPPTETVAPGKSWSQPFKQAGNGGGYSIKVSPKDDVSSDITQFEYTYTPGSQYGGLWYDISNIDGTPFEKFLTQLVPSANQGVGSCGTVNCPKNQKECPGAYKFWNDDQATHTCPDGTDITFNICDPSGSSGSSDSGSSSSPAAQSPAPQSQAPASSPEPTPTPTPTPSPSPAPVATTLVQKPQTQAAASPAPVAATPAPVAAPASGSGYALQWAPGDGVVKEGKIAKREGHANHMERHQRIRRMHHARSES